MSSEDVIVIGGGWSVSCYNLRGIEERGKLIACNESAILTKPAMALTMDRQWAEHRYPTLCAQGVPSIHLREGIAKNFTPRPSTNFFRFSDDYELQVIRKRGGEPLKLKTPMTMEPGRLNGSNSGTMAINLAFQCKPKRVFLLGFDMCRGPGYEAYWHSPYPWNPQGATKPQKYAEWAPEFDDIGAQFQQAGIEVFNVTHRSAIEAFKKISFEDFLRKTA